MAGGGETQYLNNLRQNGLSKQKDANEKKKTASEFRLRLPAKMIDRSQISIWSILKQFIGKELSKIAMPAAWCEPLSFLQRITENVFYSDLLNKASDPVYSKDPCKRMEYIAAYAVSSISSNIERLSKPFNPLLGETYELIREDLGFKILCEQVSHHPPVSAFHSDSTNSQNKWKFYGSVNPKIKFWGKSIEVTPKGTLTLELENFNEMYTWQTVTCCVHNIIVGKLWFEYYGTMEITCHQTGYKAVLNFKPYSWSNKELNKVEGHIFDKKKNKLRVLYGYWTHCLYSCDPSTYDSYIKQNKPLPTVKLDQFFNEINANNDPDMEINSPNTAENNDISNLKSIRINTNELTNSETKISPNPNETNGDLNSNEFLKSKIQGDKDKSLADDTEQKLKIKNPIRESVSSPTFSFKTSSNSIEDFQEIWRAVPRPNYGADYYNFNYFSMMLNEMKEDFRKLLAPTDSRFRTDIKQLELGDLDGASSEKQRLEEKQRESRKHGGNGAKWFSLAKHPVTHEEIWLFNNKYWLRDYSDCPELY